MEERKYNDVKISEISADVVKKTRDLTNKISYPNGFYRGAVIMQIVRMLALTNGDLRGKTVLDLGCGSEDGEESFNLYHPWLCRTLYELRKELGVKVIGVDMGNNSREEFEHYKINLLEPNSLNFLPSNTIDIAHAHAFFYSPLLYRLSAESGRDILGILIPQLERIVRPDGVFLYEDV